MDTYVTVVGNAASDVRVQMTQSGVTLARFRMAVSPRRFDRDSGQWVSGDASFYTVQCWRGLAENVTSSIDKGDPLVVTGRLRVREWEREGRWWTVTEIDAVSVGHDLARGVAEFRRVGRPARLSVVEGSAATVQAGEQEALAIGLVAESDEEAEAA
ncbi:single-stranded DNA-binding protein [Streptomyces sp. SID3343]|uniref:single-stranded DNA-binding protein n=1 Tax=Streptomyces sp. SID3343 TaxID=2690260 RepID=UPI001372030A|nr:single-stranded DNA-binding protein [Streptomyces sp. SID3343]